jgi:hypothetical protein
MYAGQERLFARMNDFSLQQCITLNTQLQTEISISVVFLLLSHGLDVTPGHRYDVTYPAG